MIFSSNINNFKNDKLDLLKLSLASDFSKIFKTAFKENKNVVFTCIGTDKILYDSFGPILGSAIKDRLCFMPNLKVYGDITDCIHALNIIGSINKIKKEEPNSIIIAVDATAVINPERIGHITLKEESLSPGAGSNKKLGEIGDYSITLGTCLVTKQNNKYEIDLDNTISQKDLLYAVNILIDSLEMAADSYIDYSLKSII